jgi:hypothetical protein
VPTEAGTAEAGAPTSPTTAPTGAPEALGQPSTRVEPRKAGFQVYRRVGTGTYRLPLAHEPLVERNTTDSTAPHGVTACYVVRAAASVDPLVESAASNEVCLEVRDVEPPAPPSGLAVLPRQAGLEVLWTPSSESDLAGYRVYRQAAGEPRARVAEVELSRSAWLDTTARPGVVYHYEVTAFDQDGNESAPTPATEASLP